MKYQTIIFFVVVSALQIFQINALPTSDERQEEHTHHHHHNTEPKPEHELAQPHKVQTVNITKVEVVKKFCDALLNASKALNASSSHQKPAEEKNHENEPVHGAHHIKHETEEEKSETKEEESKPQRASDEHEEHSSCQERENDHTHSENGSEHHKNKPETKTETVDIKFVK